MCLPLTAIQALLAIGFLLLCYQMIILKAEHFHLPRSHPSSWLLTRYRIAVHVLSVLLFAAFIIAIIYSALLGREDVKGMFHAYTILMFVFWASLVLFMLFTPFWARETRAATGMFLLFLVSSRPVPRCCDLFFRECATFSKSISSILEGLRVPLTDGLHLLSLSPFPSLRNSCYRPSSSSFQLSTLN